MPIGNKLNQIEKLKNKLFEKDYQMKIKYYDNFIHQSKINVSDDWKKTEKKLPEKKDFMKNSFFKIFFTSSLIFFLATMSYASYIFFVKSNTVSGDNIDISVLGNSFSAGGEELSLIIGITNKNNSHLELVDLVIEYPRGSSGDLSQDTEKLRESLGNIPSGGVKNENVKIILFGEQGSIQPVKISVEYRVEKSNAFFVKEKIYNVSINSAPVNLLVEAPTNASANQDILLGVKVKLNIDKSQKTLVKIDYPTGFKFISAKPEPSFGNNIWNLGDLKPGVEQNISIIGRMTEVFDGEEKNFHIVSGSQSDSDKTALGIIFSTLQHTILIKKPFIQAQIFIDGLYKSEYASYPESSIRGEIRWTNNLSTKIRDLEIKAKISGNAFDFKKTSASQGLYDSLENLITWNKGTINGFTEINPNSSGSVFFNLSTLPLFSNNQGIISDPSINVEVSISGQQLLENEGVTNLSNSESKNIKIISDVGFAAKAIYYSEPLVNSGPIPPKVGEKTTYTVVWTISNTSNDISKLQINSSLPQWIEFVDLISGPDDNFYYNPSKREIIWNIDKFKKGVGAIKKEKEVIFQIAFTPVFSQIGTLPILINDASLTGFDDFAKVDIRINKMPLSTRLVNDPSFPVNADRVVE